MTRTIRAMRSTFNLLLSIVELFIGLAFAIRIFGSDVTAQGGLMDYVSGVMDSMGEGVTDLASNVEIVGPLAFLILVLGFMLFSASLFLAIPSVLRQGQRNAEMENGYD
ncbi:MAG: hypothetical protein WC823_05860 [Parcubacteria group bacterium]